MNYLLEWILWQTKLRALTDSQEGTEVLSPTTHVALSPPKAMQMHLEADPLSAKPVGETATQQLHE